jgi:ATP-dependent Zn protease
LIAEASARAEAILAANRALLDGSAADLLTRETLDEAALRRLRDMVRAEGT